MVKLNRIYYIVEGWLVVDIFCYFAVYSIRGSVAFVASLTEIEEKKKIVLWQ